MKWKRWNPQDTGTERDEGRRIHDDYTTMKEMAIFAWREADAKTATFKRWFAESDAQNVKNVLGRIMDMSLTVPEAHPRMKDRVLYRDDFGQQCDGKTYAYTTTKSAKHHFCPRGLAQPSMARMVCNDLDGNGADKYSSKKIRSIAGTMLHESMHWREIGDAALGKAIIDVSPGGASSYSCTQLSAADKLINAQNYAYLASEAYLQQKGCKFIDPPVNTKDDEDVKDTIDERDTNAISIIYRSAFIRGTFAENDWYVYDTPVGVSALCKPADQTVARWPADDGPGPAATGPNWPNGVFDIAVDGMECQYKNNNQNPGALFCKGRSEPIRCYKDDKLDRREGKYCADRIYQQPYVYCQW
ncbi:hypothetical protein CC86DRAFT_389905 [Ophiobolus disseminans]|uniref:Uncharacterized protein n=1 Tax=Ophiobolus disseminans TaxID=1469910 RepID=A0A6A7AKF8_9PLEO|nr:hypothetical protein CC86DRAFT_389905 [Ophiobolus disseminans]